MPIFGWIYLACYFADAIFFGLTVLRVDLIGFSILASSLFFGVVLASFGCIWKGLLIPKRIFVTLGIAFILIKSLELFFSHAVEQETTQNFGFYIAIFILAVFQTILAVIGMFAFNTALENQDPSTIDYSPTLAPPGLSESTCKLVIYLGSGTGLLSAGIGILALLFINSNENVRRMIPLDFGPLEYLEMAAVLISSLFLIAKSRTAAVFLAVLCFVDTAALFLMRDTLVAIDPTLGVKPIVMRFTQLFMYVLAVRATFTWHKYYR